MIRLFHAQNGLFFRRNEDMSVTVLRSSDGPMPEEDGSNVLVEETLTLESFASVIATMSARGETQRSYTDALDFLQAAETP